MRDKMEQELMLCENCGFDCILENKGWFCPCCKSEYPFGQVSPMRRRSSPEKPSDDQDNDRHQESNPPVPPAK